MTWAPAGLTERFTVRWTGSIYLDLAAHDHRVQTQAAARVRVWVGKTGVDEQVINDWTSIGNSTMYTSTGGSLRDHLGGRSGWYPIVIEYSQNTGAGGLVLDLQYDNGGWVSWGQGLMAQRLSPLGCFAQQVQGDTHYELLMALRDSFGYQFTFEPRSLESGEFPGRLVPRLRLGRDTEHVLDDLGAVEPVSEVNAEETVDELIIDGSGLSDPAQAAQQTQVASNYQALTSGRMMIHSEQESLSDISDLALLRQRAESLLALRSAPWEEVQAQPEDKSRRLIDRFPLTGELAEFDWGVGDGLRLQFDDIDVLDETPRQIKAVSWPIRPDGRGAPAVSFRQRPRNFVQVLRRLARLAQLPQRNYQGQLAAVSGNPGRHPSPAPGGVSDTYSRANLPVALEQVVRAELIVQHKSDSSPMNIEINGVNRAAFTAPGRYDITAYVASPGGEPRMHVRATSGTGAAEYALELLVAV